MGKYRLQSRKEDAVITLMEVDTESNSWYIQADDEEGALAVLQEMAGEINCLVHIYLNGKEVGDHVFPVKIENVPFPEKELEEELKGSVAAENKGEEEMPLSEDVGEREPGAFNLPSPEDIRSALATVPSEIKEEKKEMPDAYAPIQGLPELTSVLPEAAFAVRKKNTSDNQIFIGKGKIKGKISDMNTIKEEVAGIVIQGTVIDAEVRELHGKRAIFTMKIADETEGILCKKFFDVPHVTTFIVYHVGKLSSSTF